MGRKVTLTIDLDTLEQRSSDTEPVYNVYTVLQQVANAVFNEDELESFAFASPDDAMNDQAPQVGTFVVSS